MNVSINDTNNSEVLNCSFQCKCTVLLKYYKSRREIWVKDERLGETEMLKSLGKYSRKQIF